MDEALERALQKVFDHHYWHLIGCGETHEKATAYAKEKEKIHRKEWTKGEVCLTKQKTKMSILRSIST